MNEIIKYMAKKEILPIAIFEDTLHVYYEKSWYAIEDDQYSECCPSNDNIDLLVPELDRFSEDIFYD